MGWTLVGYALYVLLLVITAPIWLTIKFWPVVSVVSLTCQRFSFSSLPWESS
jgi:hypothetical protein